MRPTPEGVGNLTPRRRHLAPARGFNEAHARRRGKCRCERAENRSRSSGFNEAHARRRGKFGPGAVTICSLTVLQ